MLKNKKWMPMIAGLVLTFLLVPAVHAESLWNDRSMFADRRAQAVGDILTIVISENFSATRSDPVRTARKATVRPARGWAASWAGLRSTVMI